MTSQLITRNNVRISGAGTRPVVFAPGFGCGQAMWRHMVPYFEPGHRVVLFDHVGAGGSRVSAWSPVRHASLAGYADDVLELLTGLDIDCPAILVGHSVSAMIGALAAIARPDLFQALVMVGPSPCYLNDGAYAGGFDRADIDDLLETLDSNYLGWSAAMAPVIMGTDAGDPLSSELAASFCATDPAIARHFARVTFTSDNRADLKRVGVPTLVLQCRRDNIAPDSVGQFVHDSIAGSTMVRLAATGHCPHLSAPTETATAILDYLAAPTGRAEPC